MQAAQQASSALGNYSAVIPGVLYGSAFPKPEAVQELLSMSSSDARPKTIVNLTEAPHPQEAELLAGGITPVHIPVHDFEAPTMEQMKAFAALVLDSSKWPVLVHCRAGIGRTGTMLAVGLAAVAQKEDLMPEVRRAITENGGLVPYLRTLRKGAVEVPVQAAAVQQFEASLAQ